MYVQMIANEIFSFILRTDGGAFVCRRVYAVHLQFLFSSQPSYDRKIACLEIYVRMQRRAQSDLLSSYKRINRVRLLIHPQCMHRD